MAAMGCTLKYYPSLPFLPSVALGALLTTNSISCDSGASASFQSKAWIGCTPKYYLSRLFSCQRHICTTLTLNCATGALLFAATSNLLTWNWACRLGGLFCDAPHLTASDNKLFLVIRGRLRPLTKNAVNGTYVKVLPIDGIFAECSTRRPSDNKFISPSSSFYFAIPRKIHTFVLG